jgi:hypothetical protein
MMVDKLGNLKVDKMVEMMAYLTVDLMEFLLVVELVVKLV